MKIVCYNEDCQKQWQDFVCQCGTLYHDIRWKDIIAKTFNFIPQYYLFLENDELVGILPLFGVNPNKLISLPHLSYAGPCFKNQEKEDQYLKEAFELFNSRAIKSLTIRKKVAISQGGNYVTMVKRLDDNNDKVFNNFKSRLRNKIRNSEKHPFELKPATVKEFYPVYLKATNALGTPGHGITFFQNILDSFGSAARINNLYYENNLAGTIFEIDYLDTRYDLWIFSFKNYFQYLPNIYLYWQTIQDAVKKGIKYYDFGRSTFAKGTYLFKKQWGAEPVGLLYENYDLEKQTAAEYIKPAQSSLLPKIWARTPSIITNKIGPLVRKHIY